MRSWRSFGARLTLASVGTVLVAGACSDAGPTAPSTSSMRLAVAAPPPGSDAALQARQHAEQQRIQQAQAASKATYDSAMAEWRALMAASKKGSTASDTVSLLRCQPQSYHAEVKVIGPEGGNVNMGRNVLTIPRGALSQKTVITGETPPTTIVQVKFEPHGLVFNVPATLTINYDHCVVPAGQVQQVVYLGGGHRVLEYEPSKDYANWRYVMAAINHFSSYAIAYARPLPR